MFRAYVLIIRRSKLHYTASGIITPIGVEAWNKLIVKCKPVHETATYMCDDTRGCIIQFWPPDEEHMCWKHVEAWNKLIVKQKFCASCWLITEIDKIKIHLVGEIKDVVKRVMKMRVPYIGRNIWLCKLSLISEVGLLSCRLTTRVQTKTIKWELIKKNSMDHNPSWEASSSSTSQ